jgi:RimJ/RimL family protein N-acetyltransferase
MLRLFHTPRCRAEALSLPNCGLVVSLLQTPKVEAALGGPRPADRIESIARDLVGHWERHGWGIWLFYDKEREVFLGYSGLRLVLVEGHYRHELLYAVAPQYWNNGYATEWARSVVRLAFQELNFKEVEAFTRPDNIASRRVMEKAGLRYHHAMIHAGLPHVLYRLTWLDWKGIYRRCTAEGDAPGGEKAAPP